MGIQTNLLHRALALVPALAVVLAMGWSILRQAGIGNSIHFKLISFDCSDSHRGTYLIWTQPAFDPHVVAPLQSLPPPDVELVHVVNKQA